MTPESASTKARFPAMSFWRESSRYRSPRDQASSASRGPTHARKNMRYEERTSPAVSSAARTTVRCSSFERFGTSAASHSDHSGFGQASQADLALGKVRAQSANSAEAPKRAASGG